jgi:hypothetical protein
MAYQLAALIECDDTDICLRCKRLLDRNTRPLFPEDVPEEQLDLFEAIEEVDYPEASEILPDGLWLFWYRVEGFGYKELLKLLSLFGLRDRFIFEVPDYPMSGDSDEDEASGKFWLRQGDDHVVVEPGVIIDSVSADVKERLPDWSWSA